MATRQIFAFQGGGFVSWDESGDNVTTSTKKSGYGAVDRATILAELVVSGRDQTEIFLVDTKKGRVSPMSVGDFRQHTIDYV